MSADQRWSAPANERGSADQRWSAPANERGSADQRWSAGKNPSAQNSASPLWGSADQRKSAQVSASQRQVIKVEGKSAPGNNLSAQISALQL